MTGYTLQDHLPADFAARSLRQDALHGLTRTPKTLPPKWFYDKVGSELFEEITRLPEYYPTRAEREILTRRAAQVAAAGPFDTLVELGSGSSSKTRLLLDALLHRTDRLGYVPLDVSSSALTDAARLLATQYPQLRTQALVADFTQQLDLLDRVDGTRLVAFLGGTIGNFTPDERAGFLRAVRRVLNPGDRFLLGADLVKDPALLVAAYDDAAGVTAAFNRNLLKVLNRELGADFDPDAFEHVAVWDAEAEWIEMRLRSPRAQQVRLQALDLAIGFARGEDLRTEISAKFRRAGLERESADAGFAAQEWWADGLDRFSLSLWAPIP
jgi:L-histidine N-alpha-methyltransferase